MRTPDKPTWRLWRLLGVGGWWGQTLIKKVEAVRQTHNVGDSAILLSFPTPLIQYAVAIVTLPLLRRARSLPTFMFQRPRCFQNIRPRRFHVCTRTCVQGLLRSTYMTWLLGQGRCPHQWLLMLRGYRYSKQNRGGWLLDLFWRFCIRFCCYCCNVMARVLYLYLLGLAYLSPCLTYVAWPAHTIMNFYMDGL